MNVIPALECLTKKVIPAYECHTSLKASSKCDTYRVFGCGNVAGWMLWLIALVAFSSPQYVARQGFSFQSHVQPMSHSFRGTKFNLFQHSDWLKARC